METEDASIGHEATEEVFKNSIHYIEQHSHDCNLHFVCSFKKEEKMIY